MKVENKLNQLEDFINDKLGCVLDNINDIIRQTNSKKNEIISRYDDSIAKEKDKAFAMLRKIDDICLKADDLVNGIKRKLFNKRKCDVNVEIPSANSIDEIDDILTQLIVCVEEFERTSLPMGLRCFLDNVIVLFNNKYEAEKINKILSLYNTIFSIKANNKVVSILNDTVENLNACKKTELVQIATHKDIEINKCIISYIEELKRKIYNL